MSNANFTLAGRYVALEYALWHIQIVYVALNQYPPLLRNKPNYSIDLPKLTYLSAAEMLITRPTGFHVE